MTINQLNDQWGTSNGWIYVKHPGGYVEAWKKVTLNVTSGSWISWGSLVRTSAGMMTAQTYPFAFTQIISRNASVSCRNGYIAILAVEYGVTDNTKTPTYCMVRPSASGDEEYSIYLYVFGTV